MEIYAEVNSKLAKQIQDGYVMVIPNNVIAHKIGSRGYVFQCEDKESREEMIDILEANGISWQDNVGENELREQMKIDKKKEQEDRKKRKAIKEYFNQVNLAGNYKP